MIQSIRLTTRKGKKVTGRRITVTSVFEANIDKIWQKIQDIDTLRDICKPKASFISHGDDQLVWKEGKSFSFKLFLHGFIPMGKHTIHVVKIDKTSRELLTEEYNQKVTIWNHYIKMEETGHTATKYTDSVDLYAGIFTSAAAWWTLRFYRHRQRKWRHIAGMPEA